MSLRQELIERGSSGWVSAGRIPETGGKPAASGLRSCATTRVLPVESWSTNSPVYSRICSPSLFKAASEPSTS